MKDEELAELENIVKQPRPVHRGTHLFRAQEKADALYTVHSGCVKTYIHTDDGSEQVLGFHLPGEIVGLDGFGADIHSCSAVALETSSVCALPLSQLEELCAHIPSLHHHMHRLIGGEIATEHTMLLLLGKRSAEERLATFLFSLSMRLKQLGFSEHEFNLSMSRREIGNYLGLAVETVSRLFAAFQDQGMITVVRRRVIIKDREKLKSMVREYPTLPGASYAGRI